MMQLEDWLDDLCVRFIVNIPAEELASIERICFQIEEAQWYYEDFVRPSDPSLPSLSLKPFFTRITQRCPLFAEWPPEELGHAFERFLKYKNRVPVRGAILLNDKMDQVLLVKGWKKSGTWSFPRGKINKDEDDLDCAIREAWEETGFDIKAAGLVDDRKKVKSIEKTMRNQNMKMFVFRSVPQHAKFVPQTRKEISKVEWFKLADLPTEKRKNHDQGQGLNPNKFYVVAPFMLELRKIISAEKKKDHRHSAKAARQVNQAAQLPQHFTNAEVFVPESPAVPSSLPEVNRAAPHYLQYSEDQHLPEMAPPALPETGTTNKAKSNALLALLHGNSTPVLNDNDALHTPQTTQLPPHLQRPLPSPAYAHGPSHVAAPTESENSHHQSSSFDLYPAIHPAAPPPSALPQLNQHTKSLLDAFNQPSPRLEPATLRRQLPTAKQSLLDAFTAPMSPAARPASSAANPGDSLLQLLKVNHSSQSVNPTPPSAPTPTLNQSTISPLTANTVPQPPSANSADALLNLLNQPSQAVASRVSPLRSYAAAASTPTASALPKSNNIAELATAVDRKPATTQDTTTKNLLSMLQSKAPENPSNKVKKSASAATLDRPFDSPQLVERPKQNLSEVEPRRDPALANKRLFDPKTNPSRQSNQRSSSARDERARLPKSPRTSRAPQAKSQGPATPKEMQKPFQPQILKRPQTSEGESARALGTQITPTENSDHQIARNASPKTVLPATEMEPVIPTEPMTTSPITLADVFSSQPVHHDPQREALLSLLKGPVPSAEKDTPTQLVISMEEPVVAVDDIQSTPIATELNQLISPVLDEAEAASAPRSRVSSLASVAASQGLQRPSIQKRETAPGDKAFLLSFLKDMAAGTS